MFLESNYEPQYPLKFCSQATQVESSIKVLIFVCLWLGAFKNFFILARSHSITHASILFMAFALFLVRDILVVETVERLIQCFLDRTEEVISFFINSSFLCFQLVDFYIVCFFKRFYSFLGLLRFGWLATESLVLGDKEVQFF